MLSQCSLSHSSLMIAEKLLAQCEEHDQQEEEGCDIQEVGHDPQGCRLPQLEGPHTF